MPIKYGIVVSTYIYVHKRVVSGNTVRRTMAHGGIMQPRVGGRLHFCQGATDVEALMAAVARRYLLLAGF